MRKIYEYMSQPPYWIVQDDDGYWLVPARSDGWSERSPFIGHVTNLREVSPLDAIARGLPPE
jgi:glucose-6-phosphate 1-epimerase